MKVKEKARIAEAEKWTGFKDGDPEDGRFKMYGTVGACAQCNGISVDHAMVDGSNLMVCPGDWVITYPDGRVVVVNDEGLAFGYLEVKEGKQDTVVDAGGFNTAVDRGL